MMKKTLTSALLLLLALLMSVSFVACADVEVTGIWENATCTSDKKFGNGAKTVEVEIKAENQSITFTLETDKETLSEALEEHDLISGTESQWGLTLETVNGMYANADDGYWWIITKDGEWTDAIDAVTIADGDHYEFTYTKY